MSIFTRRGHPVPGGEVRETLAGTFRAAVFGANGDLVSNLALVLGVAAWYRSASFSLTGVSGLAGAIDGSRRVGECAAAQLLWISIPDPRRTSGGHGPGCERQNSWPGVPCAWQGARRQARRAGFASSPGPRPAEVRRIARRAQTARMVGAGEQVTPMNAALSSFCFFATGLRSSADSLHSGIEWPDTNHCRGPRLSESPAVYGRGGICRASLRPRALRQLWLAFCGGGVTYPAGLAIRRGV